MGWWCDTTDVNKLTSIIFVINSAMATPMLSWSPLMEITLSFVMGKKSWFCDNLILAPVFWFSWLITDPPLPIIEPMAVFGHSIFNRWLWVPDEISPVVAPSAATCSKILCVTTTSESNYLASLYLPRLLDKARSNSLPSALLFNDDIFGSEVRGTR